MNFLLKSVFWLLIVAAFMPRDSFAASKVADAEPSPRARIVVDAGASVQEFCEEREEVCAAGDAAADLARAAGRVAVERAADALAEDQPQS